MQGVDDAAAWFSLAMGFSSNVLNACCFYAAGVLNVAFLKEYQQDTAFTSLIWSVHASVSYFAGPLFGVITNWTTCRTSMVIGNLGTAVGYLISAFVDHIEILIATYGVLAGISITLSMGPPRANVGYRFNRYRGIAAGIVESGYACGMFIAGPFVQVLLDMYGLSGTFMIMAGLSCQNIVFAMLIFPSSKELSSKSERRNQNGSKKKSCGLSVNKAVFGLDVLNNKPVLCILLSIMTWYMSYIMVLVHLPNLAVTQGHDEAFGALLSLVGGGGSICGRLLVSLIISELYPPLIYFGCLGCLAVLSFTFPLYFQYQSGMVAFSFFFGLYSGVLILMEIPLSIMFLGTENISSGLGYMYFAAGLGFITGPPIAGFIVDTWATYEYSYYVSGIWFVLSGLAILLSSIVHEKDVEARGKVDSLENHFEEQLIHVQDAELQQIDLPMKKPESRNIASTEERVLLNC